MADPVKIIAVYEDARAKELEASDAVAKALAARDKAASRTKEAAEALSKYLLENGPANLVRYEDDGVTMKAVQRYAFSRPDPGFSVSVEKIVK